ncbi:MAG: gluconate 2-dehydrogenase subunit 3 family protein, partial [Steroidobacteraceae bacterium]
GWITGAWIAAHWPAIADAAQHAAEASSGSAPPGFQFLSAADAADIDAIAAQIVPNGATPGAREAHAVHFIDRGLATFFSDWAGGFRAGLTEFQSAFHASNPTRATFAMAGSEAQIAHLKTIEKTAFFDTVRTLTLLGMFSAPKYGGNFQGSGWRMMGFADQHAFTPPFGYYDREYSGFVPYSDKNV